MDCRPYVTWSLIFLNVAIFIGMLSAGLSFFSPSADQVLALGGASNLTILQGEWWRLLSSMFIHFGVFHLAMNMYVLRDVGSTLEPIVGNKLFGVIYFATGIIGGLMGLFWSLGSPVALAGASGAVFGLVGTLFALLTTDLFPFEVRQPRLMKLFLFIVTNLVYSLQPGVSLSAHVGGFLSGIVLGYLFYLSMRFSWLSSFKKGALSIITFATLGTTVIALTAMKKSDAFQFEMVLNDFMFLEKDIVKLHGQLLQPMSNAYSLLDEEILPKWEQAILLSKQASALHLSVNLAKKRDNFVCWVELGRRKYRFIARSLKEDTMAYKPEIDKIDAELKSLNQTL